MDPITTYVDVQLRASHNTPAIQVKGLHDSGCAKTIMNTKTYKALQNNAKIDLKPIRNVAISSCTGERTQPIGYVSVLMEFQSHNDSVSFLHDILVHDTLDHELLLGRDFTGSHHKLMETNDYLFLKDPNKDDIAKIPLQNEYIDSFRQLITNANTVIPPFSLATISCNMTTTKGTLSPNKGATSTFEITHLQHETLTCIPAMYNTDNCKSVPITIYNPTHDDVYLEAQTLITQIKINDIPSINHMSLVEYFDIENTTESHILSCNRTNIDNDSGLTEEEKEKQFLEYLESGQYTPSMTGYIENSPSITEMTLKSVRKWNDNEFDQQFDLAHLNTYTRERVLTILSQYKDIFSKHEMDIGLASNLEMEIEVDNTKPRIQKYYPLPHAVREQTKEILDQMLEYGLLRECNEPSNFLANLLVTKKKDGSVRVLLDGRLLNQATIRKATIMMAPLQIFTSLSNKKFITLIDVSNAFWHIPIKYEHQPYTAFYSEAHGKRFCYTRAPQGLKNSPVYLHFLMCEMFAPFVKHVIHYADDILIASDKSIDHHLRILEKVLHRFQEYNIKLKPAKLEILKPEIEFIGVVWKHGTLNIPQARIQAFKNLAAPNTPKKTKSMICALSYYRKFIPNFADLAKPLMELAELHPKQFQWQPQHQQAFEKLISAMQTHTSLNLPTPNETFYIQTDASEVAGAGRIYQLDKDGNEKLIACVSRTFTKTERKYGIFRKEVLALLYTLKSLDFFLRYAPKVVIKVDAKSILYLRLCKDSAGILLRFSLDLSKYEAEIHHVPGAKNEVSDVLSRQHKDIKDILNENKQANVLSEKEAEILLKRLIIPDGKKFTPEEVQSLLELESLPGPHPKKRKSESKAKLGKRNIKMTPQTLGERKIKTPPTTLRRKGVILPECQCSIDYCPDHADGLLCQHASISYSDFSNVSKFILPGQANITDFIQLQKDDPHFGHLFNKDSTKAKSFQIIDGMLFKTSASKIRPVLPTALIEPLIRSKHYTVMGLHSSQTRIQRDIDAKFFTHEQTLKDKLKELCHSCVQCQFNKTKADPHNFQLTNFVIAPRATWAVDIIPSMTITSKGSCAIFLAVDMFTGYIQLKAIKSRKSEELIEAIKDTIIIPFGTPHAIRSDNESGMQNSTIFKSFLDNLNIHFIPCSTASPWSNGAAERAVQTIKKGIRTFLQMEKDTDNWDEYIHIYTQSHNKSTNVHGYTPEELHFGFTNPSNTEILQIWPNIDDTDTYIKQISQFAQKRRQEAREKIDKAKTNTITYRNKNRRSKTFQLGQLVLHKQLQVSTGTGGSLQPTFTGPYVIEQIEPHSNSAVIEHLHTGQQIHAHFTNIQSLQYNPSTAKLPSNFDDNILQYLPHNKYSQTKYYPGHEDLREKLNYINRDKLKALNKDLTNKHIDRQENITPSHTDRVQTRAQTKQIIKDQQEDTGKQLT